MFYSYDVQCSRLQINKHASNCHFCYALYTIIDPEFWKLLRLRRRSPSGLYDIYDGRKYRSLSKPGGPLCKETNPANLSFIINTDGVSLFKSSHVDIWPIYLVINELPAIVRYNYCILHSLSACATLCSNYCLRWSRGLVRT